MVIRQLQVERRTGKVRRAKTDVLPLCHITRPVQWLRVGEGDGQCERSTAGQAAALNYATCPTAAAAAAAVAAEPSMV